MAMQFVLHSVPPFNAPYCYVDAHPFPVSRPQRKYRVVLSHTKASPFPRTIKCKGFTAAHAYHQAMEANPGSKFVDVYVKEDQ